MYRHVVIVLVLLVSVLSAFAAPACQGNLCRPQFAHLALSADYASMSVSWSTVELPASSQVRWGLSSNALTWSAKAKSEVYLPEQFWSDTTLVRYHHHALMTGLKEHTVYHYQVGSQDGGWSETFSFTTRSVLSNLNTTFLLYGDMGVVNAANTMQRVQRILRAGKPHVDFIMHIGDISYADDYDPNMYEWVWNTWFQLMEPITTSTPYMVTPGNHEYSCQTPAECPFATNFTAYNSRFNMPGAPSGSNTTMFYSFDYGPIHWIALSTETDFPFAPEGTATFGDQLAWLEQDLKKAAANKHKVPFILAGGHRPIYASSQGFFNGQTPIDDAANLQKAVEHLFLQYGVDVFFVGHVHSYERTYPINNNVAVSKSYVNPKAPVYIIHGCGGNEEGLNADNQWMNPQPSWSAYRYNHEWGYMAINAAVAPSSNQLKMQFFSSADNRLLDSVTIVKSH